MKKNQKISIQNIKQHRGILITLIGTMLIVCAAITGIIIALTNHSSGETSGKQTSLTKVVNNFCGKTISYPKEWSTDIDTDNAMGSCNGLTFFTYHPDEVTQELKDDGRYPTNSNYFGDIKDRELISYPYSLDKLYEIQISTTDWSGKSSMQQVVDSMTADPFSGSKQDISGLQIYSLNNKEVADYIRPGEGTMLAQRILLIADKKFESGYILTIDRPQSSLKIDQSKIDKLDEFIESLN